MTTTTTESRTDIYAAVTASILSELERGPEQWAQSWTISVDVWNPRNHLTGNAYRGITSLLLAVACAKRGAVVNRWATFNQARESGGVVRKGARGIPLVLFKPIDSPPNRKSDECEVSDELPDSRSRCMLIRHFHVFHVADCEGLPEAEHEPPADPSLAAEIVRRSGATIVPGKPYYRVPDDVVQLPDVAAFDSVDAYLATAFHELVHWTAPRVDRQLAMRPRLCNGRDGCRAWRSHVVRRHGRADDQPVRWLSRLVAPPRVSER